ncbi:MAG: DUF2813 domain-containing protein [Enterobacteriaceae bacterium]
MYLEQLEIAGFRGVNRLSLTLDHSTILIGENAWGKSSLLDALTLLFTPGPELYTFQRQDFYFPPGEEHNKEHYLQLIFTFHEGTQGSYNAPRNRPLSPLWIKNDDGFQRIHVRFEGQLEPDGSVCTWRSFLDGEGNPLLLHDIDQLVRALTELNPVLRLRDSRFMRHLQLESCSDDCTLEQQLADRITLLAEELQASPQNMSNKELRDGLVAMRQLLDHYFAEQGTVVREMASQSPESSQNRIWRSLEMLNQTIAASNNRTLRMIILSIFSLLIQAKGSVALGHHARPLLLIEDPETRLHPIMMAVAWGLLSQLPLQKITTTNSGDLLSLAPLQSICRLVRNSNRVAAYRVGPKGISAEDSRRIAFHIRFNRASSLFARCWLLVEGETEVWLLSELARLCGHHFEAEGIKVIEFAQSGLKPLIRYARRMGIEWHVLVDGDEAGKKYASTTRSMLDNSQEIERDRLTMLPARDMEHFMYMQGFRQVYHRIAAVPEQTQIPVRRVVQKAIHHSNKPDLAIAVAMEAANRGETSVPPLLKSMFSRVLWLARGRAD